MRDRIEGIGYYLSCMILFNVIYCLSIITEGDHNFVSVTTLAIAGLLVLFGAFFTIKIMTVDDSENNVSATGKQFEVTSVKDLTGENYFANFSVIVLTSLALPSKPNWYSLFIFLIIEISLGIIYIKKQMYYMNPVLSLMNYSIFECTGRDALTKMKYDGTYYFLIKGFKISNGTIIKYKNINSHIVRLNNKQ